jgi:carboxymethylenebutenolidase
MGPPEPTSPFPVVARRPERVPWPSARPPMPPGSGGAGGGRRIVLEASDGNRFAAFSARTEIVDAPGVVILPDVRGLHPFYEELAVRRCRRAFVGPGLLRPDGRDRAPRRRLRPHPAPPTSDRRQRRSGRGGGRGLPALVRRGRGSRRVQGGVLLWWQALVQPGGEPQGLGGVVGLYGRVAEEEPGDPTAPVVQAPRYRCPVLGLFGDADPTITAEHVAAFREALDAGGIRNEVVIYQGAPIRSSTARSPTTRERPKMRGPGCLPSSTGIQAMRSSPGRHRSRRGPRSAPPDLRRAYAADDSFPLRRNRNRLG